MIRFREPSAWERYRWPIIGASALVLLESLLIVGLVVQRARRKRAEAEASARGEQLVHAQRVTAVGELAATLAHEINQPLGAIVSNAEAARWLVDPAEPTKAMRSSARCSVSWTRTWPGRGSRRSCDSAPGCRRCAGMPSRSSR